MDSGRDEFKDRDDNDDAVTMQTSKLSTMKIHTAVQSAMAMRMVTVDDNAVGRTMIIIMG